MQNTDKTPPMNFKNIHIGSLIKLRVTESNMEISRICKFFKCGIDDILEMYEQEDLITKKLLLWSKLLEYDFFRIYSQHLILYSPPAGVKDNTAKINSSLPQFRKNIYTKEMIDFILELFETGEKSKIQIMQEYRIPKTTLHKWINKYKKS